MIESSPTNRNELPAVSESPGVGEAADGTPGVITAEAPLESVSIARGSAPPQPLARETMVVLGLAFACPFQMDNPPGCPLHRLRNCTPHERFGCVRRLSVEDCRELLEIHADCLAGKQARLRAGIWQATIR